ncbi:toprim domain-containing protein [Burkholderia sp. LMG 13014]|uniref:toprim domain-containing protein n=1 Tax=Burkholderia sp. LMG 13014 TaxID=2709306 RepID=UPI0019659E6B|nr:toprim domain-containing protein [Burkholderia sp. LMG 13014]
MNARELAVQMGENAVAIAEHLLPNGKKHGREWKVGSVDGEAGSSLSVCTAGAKRGVWKDFSTGSGGDMLDLWCACRGIALPDAMREAKRFLGIRDEMPARVLPTYKRPDRPQAARVENSEPVGAWFASRGLTPETLKAFRVAAQARGDRHYAVFPYLRGEKDLINVKYRNIADKKDMRQEGGAEPCLFGWHLVAPSQRSIVIAEGELDAMSLYQMGFCALSVNAGAGNHQWIDSDWDRLEQFSEIFLCYDNDAAGEKGVREVANRLGQERCRVVTFDSAKDANDFLLAGSTADDFRRCMDAGSTFDPDELKSISEFWGGVKALFYPADDQAHDPYLSFCGMSQLWFEFRQGEVTVWTGYNGHGKSLLLNQVLLGLMTQGERVCVFSGEMTSVRQGKRIAKQLGGLDRPSPEYLDAMAEWLRDRYWSFAVVGTASIDRLLTVFTYAFKRYGIRHCVIDSLMMTDVQSDGPGAITAQKDAMRKLANWARANGTHIHLVAHPRKGQDEKRTPGKQDVAGAGVITDAADNVFAVWSAQKEQVEDTDGEPDAFLELHKQRNGESQHRRLSLFFNRAAQQFSTRESRQPFTYLPFSTQSELVEP